MAQLTRKERRFVQHYLTCLNGTQAALKAGYTKNTASARVYAVRLLTKASVAEEIQRLEEEHLKELGVHRVQVLKELATIGFSNIDHYAINEDGDVALNAEAPPSAIRAVSSIKKKTRKHITDDGEFVTHETELRLWNKNQALEKLGEHLRLFQNKDPIAGDGVPQVVVNINAPSVQQDTKIQVNLGSH